MLRQWYSKNSMKKLVVDQATCIGCGTCPALCGKVFTMKADGKADVLDQNADTEENIGTAITACPTGSISWKEE